MELKQHILLLDLNAIAWQCHGTDLKCTHLCEQIQMKIKQKYKKKRLKKKAIFCDFFFIRKGLYKYQVRTWNNVNLAGVNTHLHARTNTHSSDHHSEFFLHATFCIHYIFRIPHDETEKRLSKNIHISCSFPRAISKNIQPKF